MTDTITFVSHTNKPGGGELALRRYLDATNLPVRLLTMQSGGVWEGLERETVHGPGLRALRQALGGGGLVVANSMRAAFLTALVAPRTTRLVYWVRDGLTHSAMSRPALTLTRLVTARRVSHYVANSQWTASTIRQALKVQPGRVDVVYSMCGVDTDRSPGPRPMRSSGSPLRLLFLGRLSSWKAPDVAVRALAPLRDHGLEATLTIAGDSHFGEDAYAKQVATLVDAEPRASMLGHVDDVTHLLATHDVLVHCSTVPEPFGQVVVQGLAAGMPVVATRAGGPVEILSTAPVDLLYPPGDPHALAEAVRQAVRHYAEVSSWSTVRARDFSDDQLVTRTDIALERVQQDYLGHRE